MASVSPGAEGEEQQDKVELVDGSVVRGFIVEKGDNSITLEIGRGSRRILKRDILKAEFNRKRQSTDRLQSDRVEFKDGDPLEGKVKLIDGGKKVQVVMPRGKGKKGTTTIVINSSEVRRIRWKSDLLDGQGDYYTVEFEKSIGQALTDLGSEDESRADKAEASLMAAGIFAIAQVEKLYGELVTAGADAGESEKARGAALRRILRAYALKRIVPDELQEAAPEIYDVLARGSVPEQEVLLKAVMPSYPSESVDLSIYLIKDGGTHDVIRSLAVDFLRRLQMNQALLDLYNDSVGELQLIAAIALARNRILLGAPTLIEGLSLKDEQIRGQVAKALRESTRQDFRFRASGTTLARNASIRRWKDWWQKNQLDIEKTALIVLRGGTEESPEWQEAERLWKLAHEAWAQDNVARALSLLKESLTTDPTFVKGSISLAVLYYVEMKKPEVAERILEELVERPLLTTTEKDNFWIHLELANVYQLEKKYSQSLQNYEECLALEPDSIRAVTGKADCEWLLATGSSSIKATDRRESLRSSLTGYQKALEMIDGSLENLVVLLAEELPQVESLPFERRVHNRSVLEVRTGYQGQIVRLHHKIAKVQSVLGKHEDAILSLRKGLDYLGIIQENDEFKKLEAALRSYLGLSYERLGKDLLALEEYRHVVRRIDRENIYCKQGIERLKNKVSRQGK